MATLQSDRGVVLGPPAPLPPSRSPMGRLLPPAILVALGAAALAAATAQALVAVAIPGLLVGALAATRWPAGTVAVTFLLTGTVNVLTAYAPIPVGPLTDFLLASLWIGVLGTHILGRAKLRVWFWPALLAGGLYITLTAFQIVLTDPVSLGFRSFRGAAWFMAAVLLVAMAPWPARIHTRIAKGILLVAVVVGAYSVFRWIVGPGLEEAIAARSTQAGLPKAVQQRFFGTFLSANQLAAWTATAIPFCFAIALGWRGRWRLIALSGIAMLSIALLASDVRIGLLALVVGGGITLSLFLLSPAFRRRRAAGIVALVGVFVAGGGAFMLTVGSDPERLDRYAGIFTPGEDEAYTDRLTRWEYAIEEMEEQPWGHGLGTAGGVALFNEFGRVGPFILDNSYLKVGLEQGFAVMGLYFLALLTLLIALAHRVVLMRSRHRATLAIGAAGSLGALMVLFYGGNYLEGSVIAGAWLIVGLGVAQVTVRGDPETPDPLPGEEE